MLLVFLRMNVTGKNLRRLVQIVQVKYHEISFLDKI